MQALTNDIQRLWPGTTVWGKGDPAHQGSASDHNEDDTPGSRPEQTDSDNTPEHRAIDVALLGPFRMADARVLRARLTDRQRNRPRLRYVILEQSIWRKRNGWRQELYAGEFHNHLHASGDAYNDEDGSPWDIDDVAPAAPASPKGDEGMRILVANLSGRATLWTGLRNTWPLTAETDPETVSGLLLAGGVKVTFSSATALVGATGPVEGKSVAESVALVEAAG